MAKYITEVFKEINEDPDLLKTVYKPVRGGGFLQVIFNHAFNKNMKFLLPEGTPPFKPDPAPMGMSPSRFQTEVKKFYIYCDTNVHHNRRQMLFIQALESIHPEEAKILLAIKDQTFTKLYPKINRKILESAGYLPVSNEPEEVKEVELQQENPPTVVKRGRGRPKKTVSNTG